jgi:hypothetical protein
MKEQTEQIHSVQQDSGNMKTYLNDELLLADEIRRPTFVS